MKRNYVLDVDKYIIAHVDGRGFSKSMKTRFKLPFDDNFVSMMNLTAKYLCENIQGCKFAYVQSDEISLLIKKDTPEDDIFFGGRLCKMQSIIASLATCEFNKRLALYELLNSDSPITDIANMNMVQFDCKVWEVDSANDAVAWFLFRNIDCVRNSKQQTAQTWIEHKELVGKNTDEQLELLKEKEGIDWNSYPDELKFGRIVKKIQVMKTTEINGESVDFYRSEWKAFPGTDLTNKTNRAKFIEEFNIKD